METFQTTNQTSLLLLKVKVDTTESVFTNVYQNINGQKVKPAILNSEPYENGNIDLDNDNIDLDNDNNIRWKEIGNVFYFKGKKIEILSFVLHLPANLSEVEYSDYINNNVKITYYLSDGSNTEKYSISTADIKKFTNRTAVITQTIEIS